MRRWVPLLLAVTGCARSFDAPHIESVEPSRVAESQFTAILLKGDFRPTVKANFDEPEKSEVFSDFSVTMSREGTTVRDWAVSTSGTSELRVELRPPLERGAYDVNVMHSQRGKSTVPGAIAVVACLEGPHCGPGCGQEVCTAEGGCSNEGSLVFLDTDLDGRGNPDAGQRGCLDAGVVTSPDDCNDGDPFTFAGAPELCDLRDNDCDQAVDEGSVCADAGWVRRLDTGGVRQDWRTVAARSGSNDVWVAGLGGQVYRRGNLFFRDVSAGCDGDWFASQTDSSGDLYLGGRLRLDDGGTAGILKIHDSDQSGCRSSSSFPATTGVSGVVDLRSGSTTEVYAVGFDGRTFLWRARAQGSPVTELGATGVPLFDVHASSTNSLFAVGGVEGPPAEPRVFRYNNNRWNDELVQNLPGRPAGMLRSVWVVSDSLAFAVGDNSLVLRRSGNQWAVVTGPPGAVPLRSVRAFANDRAWAVDLVGGIWAYDGTTWTRVFSAPVPVPLYDIAGRAADDLWVVGDNGVVLQSR